MCKVTFFCIICQFYWKLYPRIVHQFLQNCNMLGQMSILTFNTYICCNRCQFCWKIGTHKCACVHLFNKIVIRFNRCALCWNRCKILCDNFQHNWHQITSLITTESTYEYSLELKSTAQSKDKLQVTLILTSNF